MTPGTLNLTIYRGDTYRWQFKLWQDTGKTLPADLTGASCKAEIRAAAGGGALITAMACTVTVPNTINGVLSTSQTSVIPKTGGVWDLQVTYASGDVQTVLAGTVTTTVDVTDSTTAATMGVVSSMGMETTPGRTA